MKRDPIVEEVRRVRHQIEAECGNDPEAYARHLRQVQEGLGRSLVRRRPQPALAVVGAAQGDTEAAT